MSDEHSRLMESLTAQASKARDALEVLEAANVSPKINQLIVDFYGGNEGTSISDRIFILVSICKHIHEKNINAYPQMEENNSVYLYRYIFEKLFSDYCQARDNNTEAIKKLEYKCLNSVSDLLSAEDEILREISLSERNKQNASNPRTKNAEMHAEIQRIGRSVRQTHSDHEVTGIVMQRMADPPSRPTVLKSLRRAGVIK
ncbi:hypothetical protein [Salinisphaera orenii]|uniref:hypothetical protein n=1 Tax=Salinisphaera orenii TaxID=856731 RepID=UPI000F4B5E70|nr:hypothetical protein [Salinisphaera orenii]